MPKFRGKCLIDNTPCSNAINTSYTTIIRIARKKWSTGLVLGLHAMFNVCAHPCLGDGKSCEH